ncbi:MAG TPA: hypothetical protein VLA56_17080 [Pseudomonadales bacterium]|nr:hypothetical protein [Pseudomonadales bacterium]
MAQEDGQKSNRVEPFAQLQQFITDWERRIDSVANRVMGTDEFSRTMNAAQKIQLGMQKAFMEAMANHLNNLNMPSRSDITDIGATLVALEQRLARIEAMLARQAQVQAQAPGQVAAAPARRGPPRTRKPPSAGGSPAPGRAGGAA